MDFFRQVLDSFDPDLELITSQPVAGGCINNTYRLSTNRGTFFLKWNNAAQKEMIHADRQALTYLSRHSPIRIPEVFLSDETDGKSFLLLEWIEKGYASQIFWKNFGSQLAEQHQKSNAGFGWEEDNFIGSLPQQNKLTASWHEFFINQRLLPQIKLAEKRSLIDRGSVAAFDSLFGKLEELIPAEQPALLHGDLWSGNFLCSSDSVPVIFDPSIHFGHRETELAFTSLFWRI